MEVFDMEVIVLSRAKAKKYSYCEHKLKSAIISINDIEQDFINFNNNKDNNIRGVIKLKFDDVEEGYGVITELQAKQIATFVKFWKDKVDRFIVHCHAGISRSAGCAAAIMKYIDNDDRGIFNNSEYIPNMTVYRLVLTELMCSRETINNERPSQTAS